MAYDVIIVGAGRTGMAAANSLAPLGIRILLLDYDNKPGGWNQIYWPLVVPEAFVTLQAFETNLEKQSIEFRPNSTVVGILEGRRSQLHTLISRDKNGTAEIQARNIIFASGSFDTPREAMHIPGTRPAGIMTAQQFHRFIDKGWIPGHRLCVIGRSPYLDVCHKRAIEHGIQIAGMVNTESMSGTFENIPELSQLVGSVEEIRGFPKVESVLVRTIDEKLHEIPCDVAVFCDRRMPNTFYLKGSDIRLSKDCKTSVPGLIAVGSCVNGVSFQSIDKALEQMQIEV